MVLLKRLRTEMSKAGSALEAFPIRSMSIKAIQIKMQFLWKFKVDLVKEMFLKGSLAI